MGSPLLFFKSVIETSRKKERKDLFLKNFSPNNWKNCIFLIKKVRLTNRDE